MSKTKIQLLDNRVMIKPEDPETKTKSGIIIPDTAKEKHLFGTVTNVGADCTVLQDGDKVMYGQYAGNEIKFNDTTQIWMRESDVVGIISNFDGVKN